MNNKLKQRLELFVENNQHVKKEFIFHSPIIKRLSALIYALEDKSVDCDAIHKCHNLIKSNTGIFSIFRGTLTIAIATMISLLDDKDTKLSNTIYVYDMMKEVKFRASDYLAVAAYQIAVNTDKNNYSQTIKKARAFYDGMKEKHWFYTSQDDYIFSAMLALSDIDVITGVESIENIYTALKSKFLNGNSVQSLAQVLVLGSEKEEIIYHLFTLRDALKNEKIALDKTYTLSSLGVLSLLPIPTNTIVTDILEAYNFLHSQKGFGTLSVSKQELLLFITAIVASIYTDDMKKGILTSTLSTSITNIIIAQQVAMIIAASSAAAASSSS